MFKFAKLTYTTFLIIVLTPSYLFPFNRRLQRSALRLTLQRTHSAHKLSFGSRGYAGFREAVPTVWNALPSDSRTSPFYGTFIRRLKTSYFITAFNNSLSTYRPRLLPRLRAFYPLTLRALHIFMI